jgi:hypothetical protein
MTGFRILLYVAMVTSGELTETFFLLSVLLCLQFGTNTFLLLTALEQIILLLSS